MEDEAIKEETQEEQLPADGEKLPEAEETAE